MFDSKFRKWCFSLFTLAQPGTPTTPTSSKSVVQIAPTKSQMPKTPKSVKKATPRNLKMVSIDFFGAQKPKKVVANQPVTPTAKPVRNTALERLAKKAEERDNQAKGWSSSIKASFYQFFFSEIGNEPGAKSRAED